MGLKVACCASVAIWYMFTFYGLGSYVQSDFESFQGYFNVFAIIAGDLLVMYLGKADILESRGTMVASICINRLLITVFGLEDWIQGYFYMYLYYGIIISYDMGLKRVPYAM